MAKFGEKTNFFENCSTPGMLGTKRSVLIQKVILAVSDVLYGEKRQNLAKSGFSKIGFTICMWGTMRKVMFH